MNILFINEIQALYYITLDFENRTAGWHYYLPLAEDMHWKAGDHMGSLGADHHTKTQSFVEFIEKPHQEMSKADYIQALAYIDKYQLNLNPN
jgi:hypothetical protein